VLAQEAATGALHHRMRQYKQEKKTEPLYQCLGGTSAERLKQVGQARKDGKSLSRVAKLVYAEKTDYLFIADSGPGETNDKGLSVPKFGRNPENHVSVSMTWRQLNQILLVTQAHYQAWLTMKYLQGSLCSEQKNDPPTARAAEKERFPEMNYNDYGNNGIY